MNGFGDGIAASRVGKMTETKKKVRQATHSKELDHVGELGENYIQHLLFLLKLKPN